MHTQNVLHTTAITYKILMYCEIILNIISHAVLMWIRFLHHKNILSLELAFCLISIKDTYYYYSIIILLFCLEQLCCNFPLISNFNYSFFSI